MSTVSAWSNRYDVFMDSENDEWEPIENIVPKKEHSTKNQKLSNLKAGKPTAKEGEKSKTNKSENIEAEQVSPKAGDQKYPSKNEEKKKSSDNSGGLRPQNDDRACFNCNGVGHLARVCPDKTNARNADERNTDTGNRGCFKCSETGHIARNCTNSDSSKSLVGNPLKDMDCYKCGETGHMARDCSSATDIRSNDTRRNIQEPECYNCSNVGHLARNCPSAKSGRDNKCYQCSEEGHIARNCPTSNDNYMPQERQEETENNSEVVVENDAPDIVASPDMNENPPSEIKKGFLNRSSGTMTNTSINETNTFEVEFEPRAYSKMILHTAKHPHCAVSGLLLASGGRKSTGQIVLTDCIPLFHQSEGLTPMVEVALAQVEARCARGGQYHIAGLYHANRSIKDSSQVDIFCQRIADKIAENCIGGRAVLVTIDNRRLSLILETHSLIVQQWSSSGAGTVTEKGNHNEASSGKWRHCASKNVGVSEETLALTSNLIGRREYKDLVDFDNHLDDLTQDYLNVQMNMVIDQAL